jgi:hypothetical protein
MNFGERRRLPDRRPTSTFGMVHRSKNHQDRHYTIGRRLMSSRTR